MLLNVFVWTFSSRWPFKRLAHQTESTFLPVWRTIDLSGSSSSSLFFSWWNLFFSALLLHHWDRFSIFKPHFLALDPVLCSCACANCTPDDKQDRPFCLIDTSMFTSMLISYPQRKTNIKFSTITQKLLQNCRPNFLWIYYRKLIKFWRHEQE
jgi:hypothetical protein